MDTTIFLDGDALTAVVDNIGAYVGVGVGVSLMFFMLGYVVYAIVDWMRGV